MDSLGRFIYYADICKQLRVKFWKSRKNTQIRILFMEDMAIDVEVLWGLYRDNSLGEEVKVVLVATDFVCKQSL